MKLSLMAAWSVILDVMWYEDDVKLCVVRVQVYPCYM